MSSPLRVLGALEAVVGFGLLTAVVSWLLSIYGALSRRQSLAREITLVRDAESETGCPVEQIDTQTIEQMLGSLTSRLVAVNNDLLQFPITYYFHSSSERFGLPAAMPYVARLAEKTGGADRPRAVRLRAAMLQGAIDDFSATIGSHFLGLSAAPTDKVLEAYASDHLRIVPEVVVPRRTKSMLRRRTPGDRDRHLIAPVPVYRFPGKGSHPYRTRRRSLLREQSSWNGQRLSRC